MTVLISEMTQVPDSWPLEPGEEEDAGPPQRGHGSHPQLPCLCLEPFLALSVPWDRCSEKSLEDLRACPGGTSRCGRKEL